MVDAADHDKIEASRNELHNLLDKPQLQGIPVLVLGNKKDLRDALDEKGLIEKMSLHSITDREICCYSISCKEKENIGESWLDFFRFLRVWIDATSIGIFKSLREEYLDEVMR